VPEQDEWFVRILLLGDECQLHHVLHQQIETAFAEVSKVLRGSDSAAMPAVVIGVDDDARFLQNRDQLGVSSAVFAEAMCNLNYAARRSTALPPAAGDL